MLEYLGLQSARQYRALRRAVAAQVETGNIVNHSNEKVSVFDQSDESLTSSVTTDSLHSKDAEKEEILVGWESPADSLNPRNWSLPYRSIIFVILWVNVFAVDWASSCDSQVNDTIDAVFHVSKEEEAKKGGIKGRFHFQPYHASRSLTDVSSLNLK